MSAKQKIVHGRGPSDIRLGLLFAPLNFSGLYYHFPPLTLVQSNFVPRAQPRSFWPAPRITLCAGSGTSVLLNVLHNFAFLRSLYCFRISRYLLNSVKQISYKSNLLLS